MSDLTVRELRKFLWWVSLVTCDKKTKEDLDFVAGFIDGVISHEEKYKAAVRGVEN